MIGKSLTERARERSARAALVSDRGVALLNEMLTSQAKPLVQVRAQGPAMIACLVVRADDDTVRFCRSLGFEVKQGGTGVFGLLGEDAARLFVDLSAPQRAWLAIPCGERETKVALIASGIALLSLETVDGKTTIRGGP